MDIRYYFFLPYSVIDSCADTKVGTDFLEEEIMKFDEYVQSVDVAAFQKI